MGSLKELYLWNDLPKQLIDRDVYGAKAKNNGFNGKVKPCQTYSYSS
jgi:hypothetical protein